MSTTLPYTRIKPSDGDDSAQWFDALEANIEINDAHNHNGVNSPLLDAGSLEKEDTYVFADTTGLNSDQWTGDDGVYTLVVPVSDIPDGFKDALKTSSELTSLVIMDTDNDNERVYLKYTWQNAGGSTVLTLTSSVPFNGKILFL